LRYCRLSAKIEPSPFKKEITLSSDNCIAVLKSKDGYRVTHAQAIDNLTWFDFYNCCDNPNVEYIDIRDEETGDYLYSSPVCLNCHTKDPINFGEHKQELNPKMLKEYFKGCHCFDTLEDVNICIDHLLEEVDYLEYGVQYFEYPENFPT
jgi:hypothetical protein